MASVADVPEMSIGAAFTWLAAQDPDRVAVRCGDDVLTRRELDERATAVAARWVRRGVAVDDVVTVALPNGVPFVVACVAAWKAGACVQPLSPRLAPAERAAVEELTRPALVVDDGSVDELLGVRDGEAGTASQERADEPTDDLPDRWAAAWKAPTSSGSTGRPKVVVAAAPARVDPTRPVAPFVPAEAVQVVAGPLFHAAPFTYALRGLMTGHTLVVLPRFDPVSWLAAVAEHGATWSVLVPTMMQRIMRVSDRDSYDVGSLAGVLHMGARCPEPVKRAWIAWLGPERVVEVYAGSESSGLTMIDGTEWRERPGSVGRPVGDSEFRAVRPDGTECAPGESGELLMRRAAPTYRYLGGPPPRDDGWHSLGDAGWIDADGYVFVGDRLDDVVVTGGVKVAPADVESVLDTHPAVRSSVVVGREDADLGMRVHAVVDTAGTPVAVADLAAWVADRLDPEKRPRSWEVVDVELRGDTGKVRRRDWR